MGKRFVLIATGIVVAAASVLVQAEPRSGAAAELDVRFSRVRLKTGIELQVAQSGPSTGEPILMLHGITDSWFSFSMVMERMPADYRLILPSQRGHGDSDRPACCYAVSDFVGDAVALLDALGIQKATVVGHSMGSIVAQRIAIDHPDRVHRLVLIGSAPTVNNQTTREFVQAVETLPDPVPTDFIREFQASTAYKPLPTVFFDRVIEESSKLPARVWRDALAGLMSLDLKSQLPRIQAPTLIMWGAHDAMFGRAYQDDFLRLIPKARLIAYDDLGHAPPWEDPARVAEDLVKFFNENDAPAKRRERVEHGAHEHERPANLRVMPLLPGLGEWHQEISTRSLEAQQYFDQGLRLMYGFNHEEAVRSFEWAAQLDTTCAMCYWGIAYGLGPNINLPMEAKAEERAFTAIRSASRYKATATVFEQALIDAMAVRYGNPAGAARAARDSAYANQMRAVVSLFPAELDAQVLFADAMLNLRPWNQWTRDGRPQPGTEEAVAALERALKQEPNHAGACHFYVHAVEASQTPERALPCAERLPRLMPGAGHLVHMPAHVFLRVGRYEDAARANIAAVEADNRYFGAHPPTPGVYPMFYAPHNLHFLWATYLLSGQRTKALNAARWLVQRVDSRAVREVGALQGFLPVVSLTYARFGNWDAVLAEPAPASDLRYVKGMWHYARGLARAARGEIAPARLELDSVRAIARAVPDDLIIILNAAPALLDLASEVLAGEIAARQKQFDQAITHLGNAIRLEDALTYDEPPPWYHSTRNLLGRVLLDAGRTVEAEHTFRSDLQTFRETGWSLAGLEQALRANGKKGEADRVAERLKEAWKYADVAALTTTR